MSKAARQDYTKRLDSLRRRMAVEDLDYVLITEPSQVRYLAGFTGSNALLLVGHRGAEFMTDPRYRTQSRSEVKVARVSVVSGDLLDSVPNLEIFKDKRSKIGYESHLISERRAQKLRAILPRALWVGFDDLVAPLSIVKDASEIASIQEAARIADQGLACVMVLIKPGIRERDVAAELEYQMQMAGSERVAFETIVASGPRSALPHGRASIRKIAKGDFVTLDFGATVEGYVSDITRTVVVGNPTPRQKRVYDLVYRAQAAALRRVRSGVTCADLDKTARTVITRAGQGMYFEHGLGHGIGLAVHEGPAVNAKSQTVLKPGMVITIEPGVYYPGWGGVRIEDDVAITQNGHRVLTQSERGLVVL